MSEPGARILVIDDEVAILKLLHVTLQAHGFDVAVADHGEEGIATVATFKPDLVILDLGLPDLPGLDVLRRIREWSQVPIIVLTAKEREEDKVRLLDSGADDYVTKPFGAGELVARIRVALRHMAKAMDEPVLTFGDLVLDLSMRIVTLHGKPIRLTPTEYELLKTLATHAGRVMTHKQLFHQVWGGQSYESDSQYVRVHIGHLRKKIEADSTRPTFIRTEPGIGYRFTGEF